VFLGLAEALESNQQDAVSRPQCALRFLPSRAKLNLRDTVSASASAGPCGALVAPLAFLVLGFSLPSRIRREQRGTDQHERHPRVRSSG
jgi:hypothetical protein